MVIDIHYHLDERMMRVETLLEKMYESGVDRIVLMAQLVEPFPEPGDFTILAGQFLLTHRLTRNIAKMLVSNFTDGGEIKLPSGIYKIYNEPDNEYVFSTVARYPDKFFGWIFVNPAGRSDPVEEYNRWKDLKGYAGVKAHPFWHRYPVADLEPVAELAAKDGKPLLMHAGFGELGDFFALRKRIPELKMILAHAGFPYFSDTWKRIKNDSKIFIDLSASSYVSTGTIRDAVSFLGPERCIFGTDGPFGRKGVDGTMDYGLIKRRIEYLFPDEGIRKRILGENFIELAGLA